uniref:Flocculation protein FLO11-like n=1 Tax=Strongyloides papillosus TaxID=174720 RepID=A0A0N5BFW3_STREA
MPNNNRTNVNVGRKDKRGGCGGSISPNTSDSTTYSGQSTMISSKVTPRKNNGKSGVKRPVSLIVYDSSSSDCDMSTSSRSCQTSNGSPVQSSHRKSTQYSSFHSSTPTTPSSSSKGKPLVGGLSFSTPLTTRNGTGSPKNSRRREGSQTISSQQFFAASTVNGSPLPDKLPLPPTAWINEISRSTQNTPVRGMTTPTTVESDIPQLAANFIRMNPFHLIAAVAAS